MSRSVPLMVALAAAVLAVLLPSPLTLVLALAAAAGCLVALAQERRRARARQQALAVRAERSRLVLAIADLLGAARHRFPAAEPAHRERRQLVEAAQARFDRLVTGTLPDDPAALAELRALEQSLRRLTGE